MAASQRVIRNREPAQPRGDSHSVSPSHVPLRHTVANARLGEDVRGVIRVVAQLALNLASGGSASIASSGAATPRPSRYEAWNDGERTKEIPTDRDIGGPAFRGSRSDYLLQMADLIAHALLKQGEEPSTKGRAPGYRPSLLHPQYGTEPPGIEVGTSGRHQAVRD